MNWDTIEGGWTQFKGKAKDDELVGSLQKHYGYAKDQAEREADEFYKACS